MTRLTSKGIHMVKIQTHPHNYATKIRNHEKGVQMQDTGDALAIKRPTT